MKKFIIPGMLLLISGTALSQERIAESSRNITDAVSTACTKAAANAITASSLVKPSNGAVHYQAGGFVELKPGFNTEVTGKSSFTASIVATGKSDNAPRNLSTAISDAVTSLKVYPNPVNDILFVQLPQYEKTASVEVRDAQGRLMMVVPGQGGIPSVNISKLMPGNYFLKVNVKGNSYSTQFIKQ